MSLEHQSYRWIHPSFTPWHPGRFSSLPYEALCTENFTAFLKLLPCKSESGLASLLDALEVAESAYKSIRLHGKRDAAGLEMRASIQVVLSTTMLLRDVALCAAAERSEVWVRVPTRLDEVRTQVYLQDGWHLHTVPTSQWPSGVTIPPMRAPGIPLATTLTLNQKVNQKMCSKTRR